MSVSAGPDIANNGLVLYLDASNIKSFRGEPTVNLAKNVLFQNRTFNQETMVYSWGGDEAYVTYFPNGGFNDLPYKMMRKTLGGSGGSYVDEHDNIVIENNKTYTISCYMKASRTVTLNSVALCINRYSDNTYRNAPVPTLTTEWQRFSWTYTAGADHAGNYTYRSIIYVDDNLPLYIYWCGFQVEEKSYATPFVNGTRGTTVATGGGWANLSMDSNHGELINNPVFDNSSISSIIFNGSNNRIQIADFDYGRTGFTVEAVFKFNAYVASGYRSGIVTKWQTGAYTNNEFSLGSGGATANAPYWPAFSIQASNNIIYSVQDTTIIQTAGTWYHQVGTFDGSYLRLYLNGIFRKISSLIPVSSVASIPTQPIAIAAFGDGFGYHTNLTVAQVKIYNKALTADEILQNYNATKSKYGLS